MGDGSMKLTPAQQSVLNRIDAGERLFSSPDMNSASGWRWTFGDESSPTVPEKSCKKLMEQGLITVLARNGSSLAWGKPNNKRSETDPQS